MKTKLTTVALNENDHLISQYQSSIVETYCLGYSDGKRNKSLDGHYFTKDLQTKSGLTEKEAFNKRTQLFIR